ncbi:MAG: sulfurtransferase-like selenium metabolism protein YedF [candidate division Zixibacteria bacterium]|nr:sulfurtransferase-like selenium metabolism protein YedF [candidate division Zixibacteria bacterium]MBU1471842.1 sulfurtransferase-like selenium metabolism protein YedF [candidate division Zixibacteria bacterium]MBU2625708.1 sulfurtransferase-like selenium metabolism protein YedF [candidate division Zixibacteria bacterium]
MYVDEDLLLILKSAGIGDGAPDLGSKLINSFLKMLLESGSIPSKVICLNTGVFLTTKGSDVEDEMRQLSEAGAVVLSCGTCLDYFDRKEMLIVGEATNMRDTVAAMLSAKKVITL